MFFLGVVFWSQNGYHGYEDVKIMIIIQEDLAKSGYKQI